MNLYSIYLSLYISIYIFVEPFLFACKLLPQRACDWRKTQDYYGVLQRECHKGVDRKQVVVPVKSAAQFCSLMKQDAMSFVGLRMANTRFRIIVPHQKAKRWSHYLASDTADVAAKHVLARG